MNKNYVIFGAMGSGKDTLALNLSKIKELKIYNIGDTVRNIKHILNKHDNKMTEKSLMEIENLLHDYETYIAVYSNHEKKISFKFSSNEVINRIKETINKLESEELNERQLLQLMADELRLYDVNILNYITVGQAMLESGDKKFIVVGGRTFEDYNFYKNNGFVSIGVDCPLEIRNKRLVNRDGVSQEKEASHITELNVEKIVKDCNIIIVNNGTLEELIENLKNI